VRVLCHCRRKLPAPRGGPANFEASAWVGLFAPKGTPAAVSQKIAADLAKAMADPETKAKMTEFGYNPLPLKPEEARALVAKESQRHKEVVTRARIALD
jgi:tripartite-type tricarboxylate transporter receptor subunit TctC